MLNTNVKQNPVRLLLMNGTLSTQPPIISMNLTSALLGNNSRFRRRQLLRARRYSSRIVRRSLYCWPMTSVYPPSCNYVRLFVHQLHLPHAQKESLHVSQSGAIPTRKEHVMTGSSTTKLEQAWKERCERGNFSEAV